MTDRPNMRSDLVDIAAELVAETEKAYKINDGTITCWVPKSQVEYDPDEKTFTMPEWLAKDKELI